MKVVRGDKLGEVAKRDVLAAYVHRHLSGQDDETRQFRRQPGQRRASRGCHGYGLRADGLPDLDARLE